MKGSLILPLRLEAYAYAFKRIVNKVKGSMKVFCLLVENVHFDGVARGTAFPLFKMLVCGQACVHEQTHQ